MNSMIDSSHAVVFWVRVVVLLVRGVKAARTVTNDAKTDPAHPKGVSKHAGFDLIPGSIGLLSTQGVNYNVDEA